MAQMDAGMGWDVELHNDREALRVAIIVDANEQRQNFLPKIDGSITLAHLLPHLATSNIRVMLLRPESGMWEYPGVRPSSPRLPPRPTLLRPARNPPRRPHLARRASLHRAADIVSGDALRVPLHPCSYTIVSPRIARPPSFPRPALVVAAAQVV
ncbi:hypothetical protein B0H13DRAFT_2277829 [Mycena leptocephala]|nr:hypothetical protein B0H13DRAFT_2277829 [Mycena leptocephala]